jgi:hypothetical protein
MNGHLAKQRAYQAKRLKVGPQVQMSDFRVFMPDGREFVEQAQDMGKIGAAYPDAIMIQNVAKFGGFY